MGEFVRLEVEDGVATLRLDRPKMNAIDGAAAGRAARGGGRGARPRRRAGGRALRRRAGVRRRRRHQGDVDAVLRRDDLAGAPQLQEALTVVARLPKPVVAAVTGYALGGGFELALTADFRVLGERAKVGVPEITLGVIPGAGGTQRLTRLVGPAKAKDLVFTGRHVAAEEALALGIADRVVPDAGVYETAPRAGRAVRARARRSRCARRSRRSTTASSSTSTPRCASSPRCSPGCSPREDQKTGMASFLEHGPGQGALLRTVTNGTSAARPLGRAVVTRR